MIELGEVVAAQGIATLRQLGIADVDPRVNGNGGAIGLGYPRGMSGAGITGTVALELAVTGGWQALSTMCIVVAPERVLPFWVASSRIAKHHKAA